jgi:hypothetical protein
MTKNDQKNTALLMANKTTNKALLSELPAALALRKARRYIFIKSYE